MVGFCWGWGGVGSDDRGGGGGGGNEKYVLFMDGMALSMNSDLPMECNIYLPLLNILSFRITSNNPKEKQR